MKKRQRRTAQPQSMFEQVVDMFASLDSDRDNVPNHRDCRPYDPTKHGIQPSGVMRERLKKLPIHIATKLNPYSSIHGQDSVHILDPRAMKEYPQSTITALGTIKKHPGIVGELERSRPTSFTFIKTPGHDYGLTGIEETSSGKHRTVALFHPERINLTKEDYVSQAIVYIQENYPKSEQDLHIRRMLEQTKRLIFVGESRSEREKKTRRSLAISAYHELKHVQQDIKDTLQTRMAAESEIPYRDRPIEVEARQKAKEELKKRLEKEKITPGMYRKILRLD